MCIGVDNNDDEEQLSIDRIPCRYYTLDTINYDLSDCRNNNLTIYHINLRSYSANFDEMSILLDGLNKRPDIIVFSETWFNEDTCEGIAGYVDYHVYRNGRHGGSISIYLKDGIHSHSVNEYTYITDVM